jgi:hypothetical protein
MGKAYLLRSQPLDDSTRSRSSRWPANLRAHNSPERAASSPSERRARGLYFPAILARQTHLLGAEVRLSSTPSRAPRPVAHRADERLDQQPCDRSRQVKQRQVLGGGAEEPVGFADRVRDRLRVPQPLLRGLQGRERPDAQAVPSAVRYALTFTSRSSRGSSTRGALLPQE